MKTKYEPSKIETKWQKKWQEEGLYNFEFDKTKEKYYNLVELPYPSGDLHLGHWFAFSPADAHARFKRMKGFNVFFPNGFDAFGLPAENAAIKRNIHPKDWTMQNIKTMRPQFATMGTMIDWSHEAITCLPQYYRWNQWIFLKMYEKGLAYRGKTLSNWCPSCQTVLANENIENGKCWRCGTEVVQKEIEQWFLKITDYADKLLWDNTDKEVSNSVAWPQSVREGQNNWIGRSEGLIFTAPVKDSNIKIQTFSAHFEAFCADTFVVIAPDHPLLDKLIENVPNKREIRDFCDRIIQNRMQAEHEEGKTLEGIFTGKYIVDPVGNGDLPIWVASYALRDYGTGIVKCSAHDLRDFEFAKKYNIRLKPVLFPKDPELKKKVENLEVCYTDMVNGYLSEPSAFAGKRAGSVRKEVISYVQEKGYAVPITQYHLHDWSVSRQRYWGTPVPMIHCPKCGILPVPYEDLPVELPYEVDYTPKGKPPLATAKEWLKVSCPNCKGEAKRDAETLDTFFDSAWYYYRYTDPKFDQAPFDPEKVRQVLPVDIYFGGSEHTLGHTLYARFFTKFFKDLGLVDFDEFALKRFQHGIILGPDGYRMSKSRGNVVNPDDIVKLYGADTVRLYLCFMMPHEATAPWDPGAITGVYRFLKRIWELAEKVSNEASLSTEDLYQMHRTIKKVGEDLENIKFNTAVASLMEWLNHLSRKEAISLEEYKNLLLLLAPFAPHITEELWQTIQSSVFSPQFSVPSKPVNQLTGQQKTDKPETDNREPKTDNWSIHLESWPQFKEEYLSQNTVTVVVQVNGNVRDTLRIPSGQANQKEIEKAAKDSERVKKYIEGKEIKKAVYVEGKLINFVV